LSTRISTENVLQRVPNHAFQRAARLESTLQALRGSWKSMRITSLDGLRGAAAYMVVISHFPPQQEIFGGLLQQFGQIGVMIFFVLSGFLMGTLYMREPFTLAGIRHFYVRRFSRVVPLYYVVIAASFALYLLTGSVWPLYYVTWDTVVQHAFFISALNVLWTIPVEVQFYALFPLIWWFFSRSGVAALGWLVVICAAISWSAGVAEMPMLVSRGSYFLAGVLISVMALPRSRTTDGLFVALMLSLILLLPDVRAALGLARGSLWSSPYYLPLISLLVLSAAYSLSPCSAVASEGSPETSAIPSICCTCPCISWWWPRWAA
jgi:peptidoglycan/LPS O-acetylase OafA/YrhL